MLPTIATKTLGGETDQARPHRVIGGPWPHSVLSFALAIVASSRVIDHAAMTVNNENESASPLVAFVVTGFGPFRNAKENPTTIIANELIAYLTQQKEDDETCASSLAARTSTRIIETSAQAARKDVDDMILNQSQYGSNNVIKVYLHLGVNYKGTKFQLEKCAYNDASFRIPDEQGYQPQNRCIVDDCPLKSSLTTSLDVENVCKQLESLCIDAPIIVRYEF